MRRGIEALLTLNPDLLEPPMKEHTPTRSEEMQDQMEQTELTETPKRSYGSRNQEESDGR